ncbi:hypothetical protein BH10PSE5_BH10PSE5_08210 [soil metagenome]
MRRAALGLLVALALSAQAQAFGTIGSLGQSTEHEQITRRALACGAITPCVEPLTLDELAGKPGTFGAVGYPDGSTVFLTPRAHCDNGDHGAFPGYPRTAAQGNQALLDCRAWMASRMDEAVTDAARLLDASGRIRAAQVTLDCTFAGDMKGRAKCDVLQDLGIVFHAAQDFYAHSNWVDRAGAPYSPTNPPGMGQGGPAPFISLRSLPPVPPQLISGCYDIPESKCGDRIRHEALNKDKGPIGAAIGAGTTTRGAQNGNFQRAVEAATADTQDKWGLLRERLAARYGPQRAALMACAIAKDDPVRDC